MASGIDSVTTAAVLGALNGTGTFTLTAPIRCLFLSAVRSTDSTADTEITIGSGYYPQVGSLVVNSPLFGFAAASAGSPSTQNSNQAATVTNMPASTWAGNRIIDSKATPRTVGDGVTNSTTTVTSATSNWQASDVGAVISGGTIPANTVILTVTNTTTVVLSQAASGSGSSISITTNRLNSPQTTFYASLSSSKTVNAGDTVTVPSGSWQTTLA